MPTGQIPPIYTLRNTRIILDSDLARVYGVPTKALNQAVKRNPARFPSDICFHLTPEEFRQMWSQFVTTFAEETVNQSLKYRRADQLPLAFTEHGALMAANVLNSERAVQMSLFIIRAFIRMREELAANAAILKRLAEIDRTLLEHDSALRALWNYLQPLLQPPPEPPKRRIGFIS